MSYVVYVPIKLEQYRHNFRNWPSHFANLGIPHLYFKKYSSGAFDELSSLEITASPTHDVLSLAGVVPRG